jgi:methylmalonyl-CoA mutase
MQALFNDFKPSTYAEWQQQISKDLKGEPFESLLWENENGFTIQPFYTAEHVTQVSEPLFTHSEWDICEHISVSNEQQANVEALKALDGGASGLSFHIHKAIDTKELLKNISIEHIYTQFNISNDASHLLSDLKAFDGKLNTFDQQQKCFIALDPIHLLAKYGEWHHSPEQDLASQLNRPYLNINAALYYESGAYATTQLGIMLAHLNEYLHFLTEQKTSIPNCIHLTLAIGSSFFTEIAKLKAARHLVNLVLQNYGVTAQIHIHAQTGLFNKSNKDANTNLLRTTTESMSAVLGGCNSLVTLPFNAGFEMPTEFSQRIARNQQHVLKGESYLNQLADVSTGSYYIENLIQSLGEKAWDIFKAIENEGGFITSFTNGLIQQRIQTDFEAQQTAFNMGKKVLVGVNKFQNANDTTVKPFAETKTITSVYTPLTQKHLG